MNLKQVKIEEIPNRGKWYKPGNVQKILFQFMESDMECAEVEFCEDAPFNIKYRANSFRVAIKRNNINCSCLCRKDRLFLVKNKE